MSFTFYTSPHKEVYNRAACKADLLLCVLLWGLGHFMTEQPLPCLIALAFVESEDLVLQGEEI